MRRQFRVAVHKKGNIASKGDRRWIKNCILYSDDGFRYLARRVKGGSKGKEGREKTSGHQMRVSRKIAWIGLKNRKVWHHRSGTHSE